MRRTMWISIGCHIAAIIVGIPLMFVLESPWSRSDAVDEALCRAHGALLLTFLICPVVSMWTASYLPGWRPLLIAMLIEFSLCVMQLFAFPPAVH